jgi:hypothetical protein
MKHRVTRRLAIVANRMRRVQRARNEFMTRWVVESLIVGPLLLDQVLAALGGSSGESGADPNSLPGRATRPDGR